MNSRSKKVILLLCFSLILFNTCSGDAVDPAWLSYSGFQHAPNQWFYLRKTFELASASGKAVARISADSKYWLWVNGTMVVREGMLKRGPNPENTYFDEVDLEKYLTRGKNTIAAQIWYFGKEGFSHKDSKRVGFFFDCRTKDQRLISDGSWKIHKSRAHQDIKEGKPANYRLPESNLHFVASNELSDWQTQDFDDSSWPQAVEAGPEGVTPWNRLIKRPIPQWKDYGRIKVTDMIQEGSRVIMPLPYNMQFSFWFKIKANQGQIINVTTDNFHVLKSKPVRAKYTCKAGVQEYEHFPWLSGHKVYFDLEEGIEIIDAGYRETGYNTEMDGVFTVDDPFMMRLLEKANRTLYVNMRDTYFDCPDRERAQWWGDIVLLMEEGFYALDTTSHALSRKAILELVDWQKDNGVLYSPIPAGNWDKELPQQMLAAIGLGFKNYVFYTGETKIFDRVFPHVKKYLGLWKVDANGHVYLRDGGWNWADWGEQIDVSLLEHAWLYLALESYSEIAEHVGDELEKLAARKKMETIKTYVNTNFWTTEGYKSTDYKEEIDDRGNALMVIAGIASPQKFETLGKLFKKIEHSSPYMDKYVLEALFKMGKAGQALQRIKKRYKLMTESWHSTLWELFTYGDWSYNHAWSGGPLSLMYKYAAGIRPMEIGFNRFQVFPDPNCYKKMQCSFSTVKGEISMVFRAEDRNGHMKLTVPAETEAIIKIPVSADSFQIAGKDRYGKIEEIKDPAYHYFSLPAGDWTVSYEIPAP